MKKIDKIMIGTHNGGKFKEIYDLLPRNVIKVSPQDLNLSSPEEKGETFKENSKIKAKYFSEKSNLVVISDDSGLVINLLSGAPGILSSRWAGPKNDFNIAIKKVYEELKKEIDNRDDKAWIKIYIMFNTVLARWEICFGYWNR